MERKKKMEKRNGKALLPIFVFVVLYLGLGILFEYGLRIEMGFYKIPVVVIFLIALLVACLQNRSLQLNDKLAVMGTGISDPNIITMILIFMLAGIFVGVVGRSSANSVAYFILSLIPPQFAVAVLFIVSCLVSLAMGTSVGTITLIVPIGIAVAKASGFSVPLCIASVMSGAMFGDNLSFISDTTIAACNGQGCKMTDKFKENFFIALPAAIVSVIIIFVLSVKSYNGGFVAEKYNLIQTIPYILVLIGGIVGLNVFLVLIIGVISGSVIMIATGMITPTDLLGNMGTGAAGMFETSMVAILVAAICALIKEYGGFAALLHWIKQVFKGRRGGLLGMGLLVGLMDIATANNTVAIVMANPIAKEMSKDYGISSRKAASILDTFSCVFQGILPYGAQMLVAIAAASGLGETVNAFEIMPKLFYPYMLLISSLLFIFFGKEKQK
ncbi:Na+/H+ antiporter NhaC family protein [Firmicutes bacterium AM29-6AC]|nr:Na+/H+ antiporter NhaC family protein [Firmicutes bacterium AF19-2LB]RHT38465.1 Na+/H+ antiporter NhaC family protein [Firmicutes bacterium AM29-6AC]